ncbi:MAG: glutathione S-transferase family protein [Pseudomonadales bacterium]|nr:glutathione S-transferase family protein [Pseudomonadales bacterium]
MIVLHTMERRYPWGTLRSTFSSKTKVVLEEKGLAYRVERVRIGDVWKKVPEVLAKNPLGKVPWIDDGDITVYDSSVINEYLNDRYPEPPLLPADPVARARARALENYADEIILSVHVPKIWMPWWSPPDQRDEQEMDKARTELRERALPFVEERLGGREYLAGDFSLADVPFMSLAMVLQVDGMPLDGLPNVAAYLERLRRRPSYRAIDPRTSLEESAGREA